MLRWSSSTHWTLVPRCQPPPEYLLWSHPEIVEAVYRFTPGSPDVNDLMAGFTPFLFLAGSMEKFSKRIFQPTCDYLAHAAK
jgi:hypothetical protein